MQDPAVKRLLFERSKELQRISSVPLRSELEAEKDDGRRTPTTTTSEERYRALPSGAMFAGRRKPPPCNTGVESTETQGFPVKYLTFDAAAGRLSVI